MQWITFFAQSYCFDQFMVLFRALRLITWRCHGLAEDEDEIGEADLKCSVTLLNKTKE